MKIDYNKAIFSEDEKKLMANESIHNREKNPDHVPVLIQIKSNVLKMEKQKFLINRDVMFSEFVSSILKKKLINLNNDDSLVIKAVTLSNPPESIEIQPSSKLIKDIYEEFSDPETNLLILKVSRNTTFKVAKSFIKNILF